MGMIMIFACMLSWAYGSLFVGKADLPQNYFVNTGYQMVTGGITLAIISLAFDEKWIAPTIWSESVQLSMGLLITFGSIMRVGFDVMGNSTLASRLITTAGAHPDL